MAAESSRADMVRIGAQIAALDAQLKAITPQYFQIVSQPPLSLDEAQSLLRPDEAALLIVPSAFGTHVMAMTSQGTTWHRAELSEDQVDVMVARLRRDLDPVQAEIGLPGFDRATSHALYSALVAPVEAALAGKTHLFIAATGSLASLPFSVLVTRPPIAGEDEHDARVMRATPWFGDAYALVQIPSLQSLSYLRDWNKLAAGEQIADTRFAGYGDPLLSDPGRAADADGGSTPSVDASRLVGHGVTNAGAPLMDPTLLRTLKRLPHTASELEAMRTTLGAPPETLHLGSDMTESAIRGADLSHVQVLTLATHGLTASESGARAEPGLVFTPPEVASNADDGFLAASEVVSLDLTGSEWVILSACNTAAPSGKPGEAGLSGLARAFFFAGAPTLLASHWPVFDEFAAQLTVGTLARSQKPGISRAQALQTSMKAVRQSERDPLAAFPVAWAPFTIVGEGR